MLLNPDGPVGQEEGLILGKGELVPEIRRGGTVSQPALPGVKGQGKLLGAQFLVDQGPVAGFEGFLVGSLFMYLAVLSLYT